MIEIPHEWMPWVLCAALAVGLYSAIRVGLDAFRGDVWRDDK